MEMFADENTITKWYEDHLWNGDRCCGHCGSLPTKETPKRKPMPYWCSDCRKYFSVRTGTALAHTKIPLRKWGVAIYLELTSLKINSCMKLPWDIGVSQPAAWFMLHRIRKAWNDGNNGTSFSGPVEADETDMGGKRRNMPNAKRKKLTGHGSVGKTAVAGIKDRASNRVSAKVVPNTTSETMSRFIMEHVKPGTEVYTD